MHRSYRLTLPTPVGSDTLRHIPHTPFITKKRRTLPHPFEASLMTLSMLSAALGCLRDSCLIPQPNSSQMMKPCVMISFSPAAVGGMVEAQTLELITWHFTMTIIFAQKALHIVPFHERHYVKDRRCIGSEKS